MASNLKPLRRVVTGNDERGRSKVVWENSFCGYLRFRLCSTQCADRFMQAREASQAQKKLSLFAQDTSTIPSLG